MSHEEPKFEQAEQPAGGWGSAEAIGSHLWRERALFRGSRIIFKQNKPDGYACVSCSWAKPAHPHAIEACENGIKATAWEVTARRAPPEFFAEHTVTELLAWSDLELESTGRLTEPMAWNAATDKYERCTWEQAFSDIGRQLKKLPPKDVVFEVVAATVAKDNVSRAVSDLRVTPYDIPEGCIAGYYPELNPLIPLWHHAEGSQVPAAKSIPVTLRATSSS
jgi:anaerobic selenocysteine-containing dehydrogenase